MTLEQVKVMSDEELRIKVAKLCGWKFRKTAWFMRWLWGSILTQRSDGKLFCGYFPKYATDLNAMHEAENLIPPTKQATYGGKIADLTGRFGSNVFFKFAHATARQRAEAFVLTMEEKA